MPGIDESLLETMRLPGARGALVADWISGLALGAVGEAPGGDAESTAAETAEFARLAVESGTLAPATPAVPATLGTGSSPPPPPGSEPPVQDLILTTADAYHLLRFVSTPFDSTVFLYLWLDRTDGNLALARIRLAETADRLVLG
ncbi:hypothetical protein CD934_32325 [Streptomyces calvus]|uniref:Uncharacterized protein n=1 Tax=Streptomyces calvus TaxID=67282 RepID=A0A514JZS4_9ACTN|nr:hypothetical protein [Streptomyces calvus]QDI72869.1 hypothetical protein CD934_32325 [Streptomyces calvus]